MSSHVAQVVQDQQVEAIELRESLWQAQLLTSGLQPLHDRVAPREQHSFAGVYQRVNERAYEVALAYAGRSKHQHVGPANKPLASLGQRHDLRPGYAGHRGKVEAGEAHVRAQARVGAMPKRLIQHGLQRIAARLDGAVLVRLTRIAAARAHAAAAAHIGVAARELLLLGDVVESRRQAVRAVLLRHPAQPP